LGSESEATERDIKVKPIGYVSLDALISLDRKGVTSVRTDIRSERTLTHQHPIFQGDSAVEMKKVLEYTLDQLADAVKMVRDSTPAMVVNRYRGAVKEGRYYLEKMRDEGVERPVNMKGAKTWDF